MHLFFSPVVKHRPFIIEVDTTKTGSASNTFILPLAAGQIYNFVVEWGDGTAEKVTSSSSVTHVYPASGIYRIKIHGYGFGRRFPQILFNNTGDCQKLINIIQWGDIKFQTFANSFNGCVNLVYLPNDRLISPPSLNSAFFNCAKLLFFGKGVNCTQTTNMGGLFYGCTVFNVKLDIDTSNVTAMNSMLRNCPAYKQDLSHLSIRSLTNAGSMMQGSDINDTGTTTRYDALLNSWASQSFQPNVPFHAGSAKYSSAASAARATLVAAGWTITDGGLL